MRIGKVSKIEKSLICILFGQASIYCVRSVVLSSCWKLKKKLKFSINFHELNEIVLYENNQFLEYILQCPYSMDPSGSSITFDRDARSLNDIPRLKRQSKQIFTMEQYTPRERSEIVEIYIQQNKSIVKTQCAFKK